MFYVFNRSFFVQQFYVLIDEYGFEKVVYFYELCSGMKGIVVVDNIVVGLVIGGICMVFDVIMDEVFCLVCVMIWKNVFVGLCYGGGKVGILVDLKMFNKEQLICYFVQVIEYFYGYILGFDMGIDEMVMVWVCDEIGCLVGLLKVFGGILFDQVGVMGFGIVICGEVVQEFCDMQFEGVCICIQGFGNVGQYVVCFFVECGVIFMIVVDFDGMLYDFDGIDVDEFVCFKNEIGKVMVYEGGQKFFGDVFIDFDYDVFVLVVCFDVIDEQNVLCFKCKVILQGVNILVIGKVECILYNCGIFLVLDFVVNVGGVICVVVEYQGGMQKQVFEMIEEKICENICEIFEFVKVYYQMLVEVVLMLVKQCVGEVMVYCC